jgi:hypothetical protein
MALWLRDVNRLFGAGVDSELRVLLGAGRHDAFRVKDGVAHLVVGKHRGADR